MYLPLYASTQRANTLHSHHHTSTHLTPYDREPTWTALKIVQATATQQKPTTKKSAPGTAPSAHPPKHPKDAPTNLLNVKSPSPTTAKSAVEKPLRLSPAFHKAGSDEEQIQAITDEIDKQGALPAEHQGVKEEIGKRTLMHPRTYAKDHPAAAMLRDYATQGCPVDCGPDWTEDQIVALLERGPHVSAKSKAAITFLRNETKDKIKEDYAIVKRWGDIKNNIPAKLKISPVAMVPHKSKKFRCILDLSFGMRIKNKRHKSVNETTSPKSRDEAMLQLGQTIRRIIYTMECNRRKDRDFYFTKLDIKDGFWRLAVNNDDAWNFAYVLPSLQPHTNTDDIEIVIPNSLQMGWCESPPLFCSASETGRDVIERLLQGKTQLPPHLFEERMFDPNTTYGEHKADPQAITLVEVYVDDYICATNDCSREHLTQVSRAMLHGIHAIFPPPDVTGHNGGDPIAEKKIAKGEGIWATEKEILGWEFNGHLYTITLPTEKSRKIEQLTKKVLNSKATPLKRFQELAGKLQHASLAIHGGRGLFSPIYMATKGDPEFVTITKELRRALEDWRALVQHMTRVPTPIQLLVPDLPSILKYTDACNIGAGGVVVPGSRVVPYIVWKLEWPDDIKQAKLQGSITINDLELAGMVLGWLVVDALFTDLKHQHIGIFCDNTSAVSWLRRGSTSTSQVAAALLRFLHLRIRQRQASSFIPESIKGEDNDMADVSSRAFKKGKYFKAEQNLTSYFNSHFPQSKSWLEYTLPNAWVTRVMSCLRGTPLPMASLLRLPKIDKNIGATGAIIAAISECDRISNKHPPSKQSLLQQPSVLGSGLGTTVKERQSQFKLSLKRSRPSARPSSWLDQTVPSTKRRTSSTSQYNAS